MRRAGREGPGVDLRGAAGSPRSPRRRLCGPGGGGGGAAAHRVPQTKAREGGEQMAVRSGDGPRRPAPRGVRRGARRTGSWCPAPESRRRAAPWALVSDDG